MKSTSLGGHLYVANVLDSYIQFARAYFMKRKSKDLAKLYQFCIGESVLKTFSSLALRSDGGVEYNNKAFDELFLPKVLREEKLLLIPRIRMMLLSVVGELL